MTLPPRGGGAAYHLVWDSAWEVPAAAVGTQAIERPSPAPAEAGAVTVTAASVRVYSLDR